MPININSLANHNAHMLWRNYLFLITYNYPLNYSVYRILLARLTVTLSESLFPAS